MGNTTALDRLWQAQVALSERTEFSPDCIADISKIAGTRDMSIRNETTLGTLVDAAAGAQFRGGPGSLTPLSSVYSLTPAANSVSGTIGQFFALNPGTTAISQFGAPQSVGSTIYYDPAKISNNLSNNMALLMHEAFHLLGFDDADLQTALGLPVDPKNTRNISIKLLNDCIRGKGNK
jgi:hypothetical protein